MGDTFNSPPPTKDLLTGLCNDMTGIKQAAESARTKSSEVMAQAKPADLLHTPYVRAALPFINGGIAGMVATSVIQPVDMVKVRIQLAGEGTSGGPKPSPLAVTRQIIASDKVLDLYTGLSAGLLRQAVYTTARLGMFDTLMGSLSARAKSGAVLLASPSERLLV